MSTFDDFLKAVAKEHNDTIRTIKAQISKLEINKSYRKIRYYDYDLFRTYLKRKFPLEAVTMYDNGDGTADINLWQ